MLEKWPESTANVDPRIWTLKEQIRRAGLSERLRSPDPQWILNPPDAPH
jgi:hypothetical protein